MQNDDAMIWWRLLFKVKNGVDERVHLFLTLLLLRFFMELFTVS